jgi:hypothetical protein
MAGHRRGVKMPLHRLIDGEEFQPEHLQAMGRAFDETLSALDLKDRSDPIVEMIARQIILLAERGERDPDRLRDLTIKALTANIGAA